MPFREFVSRIQQGVGSNPTYTWVDADFLRANGANPYGRELPVFQVMKGRTAGFARFDLTPELTAGLRVRPMEDTARDTLAWWKTLPAERQAAIKTGFTPEREGALLKAWKERGR
jgi:2'-hydroxyisoflavone reductase